MTNYKHIDNYIYMVRHNIPKPYCKWQHKLCDFVEKVFAEEDIYVDEEQLSKYFELEKYFPYRLLPWERFVFALHICTYTSDGDLRFPYAFVNVGRGAGKNGLLSFIDFCLLTPVHGVREYDIYIYAMSEDQAKRSWMDVYNILEDNKVKMKKFFYWTKEVIMNKATRSSFFYCTSNAKTKDSQRPGKVDNKTGYVDSLYPIACALVNTYKSVNKPYWTKNDIATATEKASERIVKFIFGE